MKTIVQAPDTPAWPAISAATVWRGLIFASGEGGVDTNTLEPVSTDVAEQARQALRHLETTLHAAGSSLKHVLKVNAYLGNPDDLDTFNRVFADEFPELPPARTTVGVIVLGGLAIELELIAYVPDQPD